LSLVKYIFSKSFIKTLFVAVVFALLVVAITWFWLRSYTKHGEQIPVPNVSGLVLKDASKLLDDNDLSYKLIDSTFVKGKEGIIYSQIPAEGANVKSGREIYLKIYRTIPPQKPVRFKVGEPLEIAKTKILSKGFEIETKYQAGEFNNVVLGAYYGEKELKDGDMIGMGEKIKLIVSEKKTTRVDLPNLYGKDLTEAKIILSGLNLNLDLPLYGPDVLTKSDTLAALIYKQIPKHESGKVIRAGSTINVWLKNDLEPLIEQVNDTNTPDNED